MSEAATRIDRPVAPVPASLSLPDLLRVSRAGLIASHLWAFLVPAIHGPAQWSSSAWVGLVYVTVPLGLLIYGWNDYFDWDVDPMSPRKLSRGTAAFFGPSLSREQLASLPLYILGAQLPFALAWAMTGHPWLVGWMALMALGNGLYNGPGLRLSRVPVAAELTATGIYLLIVWLGVLTHSPVMPWWCWLFAALSILNFQILGTLADAEQDAAVGKRTLSVAFGRTTSRVAVLVSLLIKAALTLRYTGHLPATAVILAGAVPLLGGFSFLGYRRSGSSYTSFILLDWIWLGLMFLR
jgi:4-hydroxybenzoate polyprenyltransferase